MPTPLHESELMRTTQHIWLLTLLGFFIMTLSALTPSHAQNSTKDDDEILSPEKFYTQLKEMDSEEGQQVLLNRVKNWVSEDALAKGPVKRTEGLYVSWIVRAPGAKRPLRVMDSMDDRVIATLMKLAGSDLYVGAVKRAEGEFKRVYIDQDGAKIGADAFEVYTVHPDLVSKPEIPKGKLTQMPKWKSKIYPDTERDWWVYTPSQYRPDKPACCMIIQDGGAYTSFVPTVFDNLISQGAMPVTVAIFLNPGSFADNRKPGYAQRSFEYDTLSPQYSKFLLEEILPEVEKTVKLRHDAASRGVVGLSSGGICAFTAAWERPVQFSKVLSWIGSFTGIASGKSLKEGGNNYPVIIRKSNPKAIRVFLQDGENDLDNDNGNWPLANKEMAKALAFKSYDYQAVFGQGEHSLNHGRAIFPDTLKLIWRDWKEKNL